MCPVRIQATEKPITKIFNDDYAFTVPKYQRTYAWKTQQAMELFDDWKKGGS